MLLRNGSHDFCFSVRFLPLDALVSVTTVKSRIRSREQLLTDFRRLQNGQQAGRLGPYSPCASYRRRFAVVWKIEKENLL